VKVSLSYDVAKLEYTGTQNSSVWDIAAATSGGSGSVLIERGVMGGTSGDQLVATVSFKAISGSGMTTINVSSSSSVIEQLPACNLIPPTLCPQPQNILAGKTGATYTLTSSSTPSPPTPTPPPPSPSPSPSPSPTPSPSPSTKPKPSPSNSNAPVGSPANPVIIEAQPKTLNVTSNSVTIIWTTSEPSTSVVWYGPTEEYWFTAGDGVLTKDHKIVLSGTLMQSGTVYFYKAGGTTADGRVLSSASSQFNTTGVDLTIIVQDKKGIAVADATVSILGKTANTDSQGRALINDLPSGDQKGNVKYKNTTTDFDVKIRPYDAKDDKQELTVKLKDALLDNKYILIIPAIGIFALILYAGVRVIKNKRQQKAEMDHHFPLAGKKTITPPAQSPSSNSPISPGSVINSTIQPTESLQTPTTPPAKTIPESAQEPTIQHDNNPKSPPK
jgi:hypothetical protein